MRRWIMKDNDSKICKLKSTLGNYYAQNWKLKAKKKRVDDTEKRVTLFLKI